MEKGRNGSSICRALWVRDVFLEVEKYLRIVCFGKLSGLVLSVVYLYVN